MVFIGIDLGGTKIAAGVTDAQGNILAKANTATDARRPYQEVVRDMAACTLQALENAGLTMDGVAAIGIGIPGIAENVNGRVIFCPNLSWLDVPLRDELSKYLDKPIFIDNDATVAALAESVSGVSRGAASSVFLTLGTGLGGGIILHGLPWTGAHGIASELGHLTLVVDGVPCTCGKRGCTERYCSATGLIRMALEAGQLHPKSLMMQLVQDDLEQINGKLIIDCAKQGDSVALSVFHEYTRYLAQAINNVISFLDPEVIVLGGGISLAGEFLLKAIKEKLPDYLLYKTMPIARLELAVLGNNAGIIGAAMLSRVLQKGESL
jgi:glucokinase